MGIESKLKTREFQSLGSVSRSRPKRPFLLKK
nr:MAG TPA: hypothetical protein [Caudoviricetes sp.]